MASPPPEPASGLLEKCATTLKSLCAASSGGEGSASTEGLDFAAVQALVSSIPAALKEAKEAAKSSGGANGPDSKSSLHRTLRLYCEAVSQFLTDPEGLPEDALAALLRTVAQNVDFLQDFSSYRKSVLRGATVIWSTWPSEPVRVAALLTIYHLCSHYASLFPIASKLMYRQYTNCCRSLASHNLGQATLLLNGLLEIFALHPAQGAAFGIKCLRRLADLLRLAIKDSKKEQTKKVFCWSIVALLRFWTRLLSIQCVGKKGRRSPYRQLVHPICGLLNALLAYRVAPQLFPFHFHLVSCAHELARELGLFIPVASCLLKIIGHVAKQPLHRLEVKKGAYDLVAIYRASKSEVGSKGYLESVAEDALYHLLASLVNQTNSFAFPEYAEPIIGALRDILAREAKLDRALKKQIEGHLAKIVQQKKEIESLRARDALTPATIAAKSPTVPASSQLLCEYFANVERVREAKRKMLSQRDEEEQEKAAKAQSRAKPSTKAGVVGKKDKAAKDASYNSDSDAESEAESDVESDVESDAESDGKDNDAVDSLQKDETPWTTAKKAKRVLTESKLRSAAKRNKARKLAANEDIVEDFVLDDECEN